MWLAICQLLASLLKFIADKQLIDAGAAKVIAANANASLDAISKTKIALDALRNDADSVRNDPNNIDNKK